MPATPLTDLFTGVAAAAQQTQRQLDLTGSHGRHLTYAIPKVEVKTRLVVRQVQGKQMVFFGTNTEEDRLNTIGFRLLASPQPQEESLSPSGAIARVLAPPFLVPPVERESLVAEAIQELTRSGYRNDARAIGERFRDGDDDNGLTFLRIDPQRVLMVLVGSPNGVFLRDGSGGAPLYAVIRSVDESEAKTRWSAFHALFEMLREWQGLGWPLVPVVGVNPPARFGNIDTQGLAGSIWTAYATARQAIAAREDAAATYPRYFELRDVAAELSYIVPRKAGGQTDRDHEPFIRSVGTVRIVDAGHTAEMEIGLKSPEYVLAGESRKAFLRLLDDYLSDGPEFWDRISPAYASDYQRAFGDSGRRKEALVLLSYRGVPPKNQFLVIWTGMLDGEEREIAFRVKFDGRRLADTQIVLPLGDPIDPESPIPADRDFALAEVAYGGHSGLTEFFHACWLWDRAGDWFK